MRFHYDVDGDNFTSAGAASVEVKRKLRNRLPAETIRRVSIAMYEGEINMVVHARGGVADVFVEPGCITIVLADQGPGIPDVDLAMQEGYSTAPGQHPRAGLRGRHGLPNMKRYTDEMKIDTEVGKGTTVTMKVFV